jgi:hypothetical protein
MPPGILKVLKTGIYLQLIQYALPPGSAATDRLL